MIRNTTMIGSIAAILVVLSIPYRTGALISFVQIQDKNLNRLKAPATQLSPSTISFRNPTTKLFVANPPKSESSSLSSSSSSSQRNKKTNRKRSKSSGKRFTKARQSSTGPQTWRVFGVMVHPDDLLDPLDSKAPLDKRYLAPAVLQALTTRLKIKHDYDIASSSSDDTEKTKLPTELMDIRVVRRSLDARKKRRPGEQQGPRFSYVLDVDIDSSVADTLRFKHQPGRMEKMNYEKKGLKSDSPPSDEGTQKIQKKRVVIAGAGPAGLFCALLLARSGLCTPILLERGQPVESRGKDIGALINRRIMNEESNFAFGEGGAGTWSDGKLTTRIGRNSDGVRFVLETLVQHGAPEGILVDGAPHLGTDNLVRLLRNMRNDLRSLGGEVRFGAKVTDLHIEDGIAKGVNVQYNRAIERGTSVPEHPQDGTELILGDAVVLATGHSARDVYEKLHESGVRLEAKGFAAGFRVEHPQTVINDIQYGREWGPTVVTGKSNTDQINHDYFTAFDKQEEPHDGKLPVPSYRLATDKAYDGNHSRGVYSFCMCPGGQIVPASTDPEEVCVNGMSFSKRDSLWANSALVVTVSPDDEVLEKYKQEHGVLAGIAFQRDMEKRASKFGGGNLTVPVQRLTDFVRGTVSSTVPSSSYRLGVKSAPCHEIYPEPMTRALCDAVSNHFEKFMPGFLNEEALLHGVETRTSSPVRVVRDSETLQAIGIHNLFPAGEGAGFAGGIVSAAVDGLVVGEAILDALYEGKEKTSQWRTTSKSVGFNY